MCASRAIRAALPLAMSLGLLLALSGCSFAPEESADEKQKLADRKLEDLPATPAWRDVLPLHTPHSKPATKPLDGVQP